MYTRLTLPAYPCLPTPACLPLPTSLTLHPFFHSSNIFQTPNKRNKNTGVASKNRIFTAQFIILATGPMHIPSFPPVPGLQEFRDSPKAPLSSLTLTHVSGLLGIPGFGWIGLSLS